MSKSNTDAMIVLHKISSTVQNLHTNMELISNTMNQMTQQLTELAVSFNKIVLISQQKEVEIGCVEPWYEPCPEDPNICVHTQIPLALQQEVCDTFKETGGKPNAVIHMSGSTPITVGTSRFAVSEEDFPVGHIAGDKTTKIPRMDSQGLTDHDTVKPLSLSIEE